MKVARVALPGYNALTDTNPDHFSLFTDEDNVLIKEFSRAALTIPANTEPYTIPHNLGYVPMFLVYVYDTASVYNPNKWKLLAHNSAGVSVPPYTAVADETNLYIYNFETTANDFKYFIFYDNMTISSGIEIVESDHVIKIARPGFNALTEKDPNNLIFHSDLNTFKVLKEANGTINYTVDGNYTFAHAAPIFGPTAYMVFVKFPDGKTALLPGKGVIFSYDNTFNIHDSYIDATEIGMYIAGPGAPASLPYKYYVFETPLA